MNTKRSMPAPTYFARSLTELIDLRAKIQPDDPAVHTGAADFGTDLKTLTYTHIHRAVNRLAAYYAPLLGTPTSRTVPPPPERIVAVLVSTAVDESLLEIALARIGLTALLLSTNNSATAVAHLSRQTSSSHIIYDDKHAATALEAIEILATGKDGKEPIKIEGVKDKRFPLWGAGGVDSPKWEDISAGPVVSYEDEGKRNGVILHSSGSTGVPKAVFVTHFGLIANLASALPKSGFSALPLFHGFGHFSIFRCIYHGQPFTLIPPHLPLTSANIVRTIRSSPSPPKQHFAVPYVLKLLEETEEGTQILSEFEAVSFAGAAVPDDLGDRLVAAGVPLISTYGTTETGGLLHSRRDCGKDKAWNWLRAEGAVVDYLVWEERGDNTFELIVKDGWPAKIVSNRPDNSYATKDLFLRHPDHSNWYKYVGRLDDILTQVLGEKTSPVAIEGAIRGNSPLIEECIVFGDGRPQIGALILPSETAGDLWKDRKAYMDAIWPVIAHANAESPTHSRILPEMVQILPAGTEIPQATKKTILRPSCYKKFAKIIDDVYDRFENGSGAAKISITDKPSLEAFLRETIITALGDKGSENLTTTTDLFAFGVDSLQAARVRNVISKSLDLGGRPLRSNIVFENPSISQLADYLLALNHGGSGEKTDEQQHQLMLDLVDKYTAQLYKAGPEISSSVTQSDSHVVVLTGATGSLGAHILQQLVSLDSVSRVICLSRASSHADSLKRVQESLATRLLELNSAQAAKITSLAADVNAPLLGLAQSEYDDLRTSVTTVLHNAWPVNFVLSTESFDAHIGGAVNLLNLTLSSPRLTAPAFLFSSSVSTRQGRPDPVSAEDFADSPECASPMGYGRSKWVVERICRDAPKATNGRARVGVLRIGQLVGDTQSGVWNETEAWPLMFKSVDTVHALPKLKEVLSWFPVDLAARSIVEITTSNTVSSEPKVFHVLNNNTAGTWEDIVAGLRAGGCEFDEVDRSEWLHRLEDSDPDVTKNPTYKLLTFYQGRFGKPSERAPMQFEISKTSEVSPTVKNCGPITSELVAKWARNWKRTGFLQ